MHKLTIATRKSKLALWQAEHIKSLLQAEHPGLEVELLKVVTKGDKILDVPLAKVGGKGLFVKEIEDALLDGRADIAVHSMKDVPTALPDGLVLGVMPAREAPTDTLLSVHHDDLAALPEGALVGTSSLRRQSQLMILRPDLRVESLRGNLDTRVGKLMDGQFEAIVVATAGLNRLGLSAPRMQTLGPPDFLPAVAQGALGIEHRAADDEVVAMLDFLNHAHTWTTVMCERGFLTALEGGCQVPIAGHATLDTKGEGVLRMEGLVCDLTGQRVIRRSATGSPDTAWDLGVALAKEVLAAGGKEILDEVYASEGICPGDECDDATRLT
jgi:hydroxymethylbilane synthase